MVGLSWGESETWLPVLDEGIIMFVSSSNLNNAQLKVMTFRLSLGIDLNDLLLLGRADKSGSSIPVRSSKVPIAVGAEGLWRSGASAAARNASPSQTISGSRIAIPADCSEMRTAKERASTYRANLPGEGRTRLRNYRFGGTPLCALHI